MGWNNYLFQNIREIRPRQNAQRALRRTARLKLASDSIHELYEAVSASHAVRASGSVPAVTQSHPQSPRIEQLLPPHSRRRQHLNNESLEKVVEELRDRQAIEDLLATYSRGIDRLDRDLLLSVYHPDALDDHGVFIGTPAEFVDWAIAMHTATHLSHQQCILNHTCELDGNVAHTETYYMFVGMNRV